MRRPFFSVTFALVFIFVAAAGCAKGKGGEEPQGGGKDSMEVVKLPPVLKDKLAGYAISADHVTFMEYSPDSNYLAIAVDSSLRFGPGDRMWSEELPSDWFGVRNRKMLFVYVPAKDTVSKIAECEEIVNFYRKSDSLPVMAERWERYGAILWSPDSRKLLLLKDREAEGLESQDALIFTLGTTDPAFLDLASVWRELMMTNPGAMGTKVEKISWNPLSRITIVLSVKGSEPPSRRELIFDASTTRLITSKDI